MSQPFFFYSVVPPDRVSENRETLHVQGGTLSRALLLPTSLYPCRDKSIEEDKGRSANRAGISFGFLFSFVGFYTRISRIKQNGNCQIWRDRKSPTNPQYSHIINLNLKFFQYVDFLTKIFNLLDFFYRRFGVSAYLCTPIVPENGASHPNLPSSRLSDLARPKKSDKY